MSVLNQLASAMNRRDEIPNQELAKEIARKKDRKAVAELVKNLQNKSQAIRNDCIKVLYETGTVEPSLIANYLKDFLPLLNHKDNRMQWGAMTAIRAIAEAKPAAVFPEIKKIIAAADSGSVITRDQAVSILTRLSADKKYSSKTCPLLLHQLKSCPTNQLPMYAENAMPVVNDQNKKPFITILVNRLDELTKESQQKRIQKVLKKLDQK